MPESATLRFSVCVPPLVFSRDDVHSVNMDARRERTVEKDGGDTIVAVSGHGNGTIESKDDAKNSGSKTTNSGIIAVNEKDVQVSSAKNNVMCDLNNVMTTATEDSKTVEAEALKAGEDAVASWRSRRRKEPDYAQIDRRATRHLRYKAVDVHVKLTPEAFSYMEAARRKMNFGAGMTQSQFIQWCFGVVRKKYLKATKEYQREWVQKQERKRDEFTDKGKEGATSP